ncbi:hypothetical protein DEO72_LG3g615 [Vigna unguiculata]|uniref:Uncharacterized protein n=1 Tax=Vigna unguiculata TaxID=3917 RepID=A0A4D6LCS3_VIGUN|nr:hypothetical protein DEO72_LG3g615 [Vigna unguiculata]
MVTVGSPVITHFYPLFQFASLVLELLCSLVQCRSPVRTHFQVGKLWLTLIFLCFHVVWMKTVARPANLTQASQSRLGEMDKDSPKPFLRERSPRRPAQFFSERISRPSERDLAQARSRVSSCFLFGALA